MAWPRLVWGETARERDLRALVEGLQAERDRKDARIASAHLFAIDALDDFEGLGRSLRCLLRVTQPDDSQDGRPATDCGADGAGREPE